MKKRNKILTMFAVICIVIGILEFTFGLLVAFAPINSGDIDTAELEKIQSEASNLIKTSEINVNDIIKIAQIFIFCLYAFEGIFFIIEGWLLNRASKNGRKTLLLMILLIIGMIFQIITLIRAAINSDYNVNSAIDVASLIIKAIILKQVFEVRRLDMD